MVNFFFRVGWTISTGLVVFLLLWVVAFDFFSFILCTMYSLLMLLLSVQCHKSRILRTQRSYCSFTQRHVSVYHIWRVSNFFLNYNQRVQTIQMITSLCQDSDSLPLQNFLSSDLCFFFYLVFVKSITIHFYVLAKWKNGTSLQIININGGKFGSNFLIFETFRFCWTCSSWVKDW